MDIAVNGRYAYIASGISGLRVIDLYDPSSPYEKANLKTQGVAYRILLSGNLAYLLEVPKQPNPYTPTSVVIVDISNPDKPRQLSSVTLPSFFILTSPKAGTIFIVLGMTHP